MDVLCSDQIYQNERIASLFKVGQYPYNVYIFRVGTVWKLALASEQQYRSSAFFPCLCGWACILKLADTNWKKSIILLNLWVLQLSLLPRRMLKSLWIKTHLATHHCNKPDNLKEANQVRRYKFYFVFFKLIVFCFLFPKIKISFFLFKKQNKILKTEEYWYNPYWNSVKILSLS